jgi:hypothetical protein
MYAWADQDGSKITNLRIYNNYVHGSAGADSTAYIFISANASSSYGLEGALIYDNLCVAAAGGASNGCVFPSCNGFGVFNNTLVSVDGGGLAIREYTGGQPGTSGSIQNNILFNWDQTIYTPGGVTTLTETNNMSNGDPLFVDAPTDFHLTPSSPARGAGVDLSSYFTTDKDGQPRPMGSPWSIGAYE